MKKVLITGSTGFVGRHITEKYLLSGRSLVLLVRPSSRIPSEWERSEVELIYTDDLFAETLGWWREVLTSVDEIVHAAWYVGDNYVSSILNFKCLIGSFRMIEAAVQSEIRQIVVLGTCFECDPTMGPIRPCAQLSPTTNYGLAKAALLRLLQSRCLEKTTSYIWCRLFYLFGEGEHIGRLMPYIKSRLSMNLPVELTWGTQVRDYLDVEVAASLIYKASLESGSRVLNICSGIPVTVREIAEEYAQQTGKEHLLIFGARPENDHDPRVVIGVPSHIQL